MLDNEQKEELRKAVLEASAIRAPAALTARQIAKAARRDLDFLFGEADVRAACVLLQGLKFMDVTIEDLGSTEYWRATSAGVLHVERG